MAPENEMNETFEETMVDATVITVPIDATLSNSGEAADAKAVGDALALKADLSQVVTIDVNGEEADAQGHIILTGSDIPTQSGTQTTVTEAIAAAAGRTGADIPMSSTDSTTLKAAIETSTARYATNIPMSEEEDAVTVASKISAIDNSIATNRDAIANVQDNANSRVPYTGKTSSYNSLHQSSYDLESGTRHLIMLISANADSNGMWLVNCSNNGNINAVEIYKGSNITLNISTANKFRYVVSTEYTIRLYDLDLTDAYVEQSS